MKEAEELTWVWEGESVRQLAGGTPSASRIARHGTTID